MNFHDSAIGEPDRFTQDVAANVHEANDRAARARARLGIATWDLPTYEPAP